jgi:anti-anti-sigma factor
LLDGPFLTIDVTGLTFLSASGLEVIASAARRAEQAGGQVRVAGASGIVRRVFELTGLQPLLTDLR